MKDNYSYLDVWNREITTWLKTMKSAQDFIDQYGGAAASYDWKQLAIDRAVKIWPARRKDLNKLKGTC